MGIGVFFGFAKTAHRVAEAADIIDAAAHFGGDRPVGSGGQAVRHRVFEIARTSPVCLGVLEERFIDNIRIRGDADGCRPGQYRNGFGIDLAVAELLQKAIRRDLQSALRGTVDMKITVDRLNPVSVIRDGGDVGLGGRADSNILTIRRCDGPDLRAEDLAQRAAQLFGSEGFIACRRFRRQDDPRRVNRNVVSGKRQRRRGEEQAEYQDHADAFFHVQFLLLAQKRNCIANLFYNVVEAENQPYYTRSYTYHRAFL